MINETMKFFFLSKCYFFQTWLIQRELGTWFYCSCISFAEKHFFFALNIVQTSRNRNGEHYLLCEISCSLFGWFERQHHLLQNITDCSMHTKWITDRNILRNVYIFPFRYLFKRNVRNIWDDKKGSIVNFK